MKAATLGSFVSACQLTTRWKIDQQNGTYVWNWKDFCENEDKYIGYKKQVEQKVKKKTHSGDISFTKNGLFPFLFFFFVFNLYSDRNFAFSFILFFVMHWIKQNLRWISMNFACLMFWSDMKTTIDFNTLHLNRINDKEQHFNDLKRKILFDNFNELQFNHLIASFWI